MAFGIGTSSDTSQWFDYKEDENGRVQRFKVRSAHSSVYLYQLEKSKHDYASQEAGNELPYHHFLYFAEAHLIEDWQNVDIINLTDSGSSEIKEMPYSPETAWQIFLNGGNDGVELLNFISTKAAKIAMDYEINRQLILGKLSSSTDTAQVK